MRARDAMRIDVSEYLGERTLREELFGRPPKLKVFVSSKMRDNAFAEERVAVAEAIDAVAASRAWYWERDAHAGPYCSEGLCFQHAATADLLVLLLGDELTEITRGEFDIARGQGVPCCVFIDQRQAQDPAAEAFIKEVRGAGEGERSITKGFSSAAELQGHVTDALVHFTVRAVRRSNFDHWERQR